MVATTVVVVASAAVVVAADPGSTEAKAALLRIDSSVAELPAQRSDGASSRNCRASSPTPTNTKRLTTKIPSRRSSTPIDTPTRSPTVTSRGSSTTLAIPAPSSSPVIKGTWMVAAGMALAPRSTTKRAPSGTVCVRSSSSSAATSVPTAAVENQPSGRRSVTPNPLTSAPVRAPPPSLPNTEPSPPHPAMSSTAARATAAARRRPGPGADTIIPTPASPSRRRPGPPPSPQTAAPRRGR